MVKIHRLSLTPSIRRQTTPARLAVLLLILQGSTHQLVANELVRVWPAAPPGNPRQLPPESDTTTDESRPVAGRRVVRLSNVTEPTLEVFQPSADTDTGTAIVICPGGGHRILAYDLEGTEVAEWLQSLGVTACVLKYRVPAPNPDKNWEAAVQDAQRAVSLLRQRATAIEINPSRIGILGFSAGGQTAAYVSLMDRRQYEPLDEIDQVSHRPDFCVLVYPAYLANESKTQLVDEAAVTPGTPPMFLVHAYDDGVPVENSLLLYLALKRADVAAELHAYAAGGHGFGMRPTQDPCTHWPVHCQAWLQQNGWLTPQD